MAYRPRTVAAVQAASLVATGAWPLLDRSSFEAVTGRKQDLWLVRNTVLQLAFAPAWIRRWNSATP